MKKIGFIGAGNMAFAIGNPLQNPIFLYDTNAAAAEKFTHPNCTFCPDLAQLVARSDVIFLSVKPQNFSDLMEQLAPIPHADKLFCTIAAGISLVFLESHLGKNTHILRAMPNTPLLVGQGAVAICKNAAATEQELQEVSALFAGQGVVCPLNEAQMNAEVALHGSSPAIFFQMAATAQQYGVSIGLTPEDSLRLFAATMAGSAKLLLQGDRTPTQLRDMVCSPGGTTLAMLEVLNQSGADAALIASFEACTKRAEELAK